VGGMEIEGMPKEETERVMERRWTDPVVVV
jgi:hypothetical protein